MTQTASNADEPMSGRQSVSLRISMALLAATVGIALPAALGGCNTAEGLEAEDAGGD